MKQGEGARSPDRLTAHREGEQFILAASRGAPARLQWCGGDFFRQASRGKRGKVRRGEATRKNLSGRDFVMQVHRRH